MLKSGRSGWVGAAMTAGLLAMVPGCAEEVLKPDAGVSPFYPGPGGAESAATDGKGGTENATEPEAILSPRGAGGLARRFEEARKLAERGETGRAVQILDGAVEDQPKNPAALAGRIFMALKRARDLPIAERERELTVAGELLDRLQVLHTPLSRPEREMLIRSNLEKAALSVAKGESKGALIPMSQAMEAGFSDFQEMKEDPELAKVFTLPAFQKLIAENRDQKVLEARKLLEDQLDRNPDFKFDFALNNLEGKKVALKEFLGKVVVVDIWGTWCVPCRVALPGLIQLYKRYKDEGLQILGINYEGDGLPESQTREIVAPFVKKVGIPYPILIGDENTRALFGGEIAYPTTIIIDRLGKVRLLIKGSGEKESKVLENAVLLLLEGNKARQTSR